MYLLKTWWTESKIKGNEVFKVIPSTRKMRNFSHCLQFLSAAEVWFWMKLYPLIHERLTSTIIRLCSFETVVTSCFEIFRAFVAWVCVLVLERHDRMRDYESYPKIAQQTINNQLKRQYRISEPNAIVLASFFC